MKKGVEYNILFNSSFVFGNGFYSMGLISLCLRHKPCDGPDIFVDFDSVDFLAGHCSNKRMKVCYFDDIA
jgi:hypothetical protein